MSSTSIPWALDIQLDTVRRCQPATRTRLSALPGVQERRHRLYSTLEGNNWGEGVCSKAARARPEANIWLFVGPRQPAFLRDGRPADRSRPWLHRAGHRHFAHGCRRESDFVKKFFPKEDPIGHHFGTFDQKIFRTMKSSASSPTPSTTILATNVRPMYFRPMTQLNKTMTERSAITGETRSMFPNSVTVRFAGDAASWNPLTRRTLGNINPDLTVMISVRWTIRSPATSIRNA